VTSQFGTMAFAPPHNNAGVPIPAMPANPPSLSDITISKDYVERLIKSKGKCQCRLQVINLNDHDDETDWVKFQHLAPKFTQQKMRLAQRSCTFMKLS
jgi:hypothetical protein